MRAARVVAVGQAAALGFRSLRAAAACALAAALRAAVLTCPPRWLLRVLTCPPRRPPHVRRAPRCPSASRSCSAGRWRRQRALTTTTSLCRRTWWSRTLATCGRCSAHSRAYRPTPHSSATAWRSATTSCAPPVFWRPAGRPRQVGGWVVPTVQFSWPAHVRCTRQGCVGPAAARRACTLVLTGRCAAYLPAGAAADPLQGGMGASMAIPARPPRVPTQTSSLSAALGLGTTPQ